MGNIINNITKFKTVEITPITFTCKYTGKQYKEEIKKVKWTKDKNIPLIYYCPSAQREYTSEKAKELIKIIKYGGKPIRNCMLKVEYWRNIRFFSSDIIHKKAVYCLFYIPKEFGNDWEKKMKPYTETIY